MHNPKWLHQESISVQMSKTIHCFSTFLPLLQQNGQGTRFTSCCQEWERCTDRKNSQSTEPQIRNSQVIYRLTLTIRHVWPRVTLCMFSSSALFYTFRASFCYSFISRNVSPNFQDDMGYTALHYASMNGHRFVYIFVTIFLILDQVNNSHISGPVFSLIV